MKKIMLSSLNLTFLFLSLTIIATAWISQHNEFNRFLPILFLILFLSLCFFYFNLIRDAAKRKIIEAKLIENETRFRLMFDTAAVGMAFVNPKGEWLRVNTALCHFLGYTETELLKKDFKQITFIDDATPSVTNFEKLLTGEVSSFQMEKRYVHKEGHTLWGLVTISLIRTQSGEPLYIVAQIQDINNIKKSEQQLSYQAYHDTLTGLANRNHLEQSLKSAIQSALHFQQNFAVFFLDLDHFKAINDTLGHDAGDQLLQVVAKRLKNSTRATDVVARLGGDEFVLILNGLRDLEAAANFAEKMIHCLMEPIYINDHQLFITTSIGISFYPTDGSNFETLIKNADLALYKAKQAGRNNYQFCTPEISRRIKEKKIFETTLQNALNEDELELYFQPKLEIATHKITGFETLLRWKNKEYGSVTPRKLIELAQEAKLIIPLSEWVLKTACAQAKGWQQQGLGPTSISINIAALQYKQPGFVNTVLNTLKMSNLEAYLLALEITENLIMQDPETTLKILNKLHKHGVQITIDNFGTGYSSLNYLHQFAIDHIKIDKLFIKNIGIDAWHESLVIAIINLANNLGINIIAQGVETKEQYEFLKQHGCYEIQGYYISRPIEAKKIPAFLEKTLAQPEAF